MKMEGRTQAAQNEGGVHDMLTFEKKPWWVCGPVVGLAACCVGAWPQGCATTEVVQLRLRAYGLFPPFVCACR